MTISEPRWLRLARKELGLKEVPGPRHEARIVRMFAEAGHAWVRDDETAWCAAFANAMLVRAGLPGTGRLDARSFRGYGVGLDRVVPGCIAVFSRGDPEGWQGHVFFALREVGDQIEGLGGNQSDAVTIARQPKSRLLALRWPVGLPLPVDSAQRPKPKVEAAPSLLRLGSRGARVEALQTQLDALGYRLVTDGIFGKATRRAVVAFQLDTGIATDGVAGPQTLAALETATPVQRTRQRVEMTAEDLEPKSRIVHKGSLLARLGAWLGLGGGAAKGAQEAGLLDQAQSWIGQGTMLKGLLGAAADLAAFALQFWWVAVPLAGVAIWWHARGVVAARVADHRSGKTV